MASKQYFAFVREVVEDDRIILYVQTSNDVHVFKIKTPASLSYQFRDVIRQQMGRELKRMGYVVGDEPPNGRILASNLAEDR